MCWSWRGRFIFYLNNTDESRSYGNVHRKKLTQKLTVTYSCAGKKIFQQKQTIVLNQIKQKKMCIATKTEYSSVLIFWIAMSVLFDFFSITSIVCRQNRFFSIKNFLCYFFLLCWYTYNQLVFIYIFTTIDHSYNRTSEWKVQSKLLISWEHLGVLKIDWNDQKLKQFLWIVYCNTHSFLDKIKFKPLRKQKKIYFHIRCGFYILDVVNTEYRSLWSHFFRFFL